MRKSDKQNAIVIATIVLCFMLTLGLCELFSGSGFMQVFAKSDDGETYYLVCAGTYSDISLARSSAELLKARGGAGYVISGDKIELIAAAYADREAAQSALTNLGSKGAYLKEIPIAATSLKWCDKDKHDAVNKALGYFALTFDSLNGLASALTSETLTLADVKNRKGVLYSQITDIKSAFYENVIGYDKEEITEVKLALVTALALLDNLSLDKNLADTVSSLRYQAVQLLLCHQALMERIK